MPDAGLVHLDADEVLPGVLHGLLHQARAVAEADFQHPGRVAAEESVEIQYGCRVVHAPARPQFLQRALLRCRQPAGAADEAADGPPPRAGIVLPPGHQRVKTIGQVFSGWRPLVAE